MSFVTSQSQTFATFVPSRDTVLNRELSGEEGEEGKWNDEQEYEVLSKPQSFIFLGAS